MRKIKCIIRYPWAGVQDQEAICEVEDDCTEDEIDEFAAEVIVEMLLDKVSASWEEVE